MAYAPDSVTNPDNKGGGLSRSDHRSSISKTSSTATDPNKTLDFHQAMGDFKSMFSGMDEEIIEAVLRANNGAVDATIDQLLSMSMGNEEMGLGAPDGGDLPQKTVQSGNHGPANRSDSIDDDDLPPSYEQAIKGLEKDSPKPALPARKKNVMSDLLLLSPTETSPHHSRCNDDNFEVFMPSPSPPTTRAPAPPGPPPAPIQSKKGDPVDLLSADLATFSFSLSSMNNNMNEQTTPKRPITPPPPLPPPKNLSNKHSSSTKHHSAGKTTPSHRRRYRKWNPPLLGTLPDDFLRLEPPPKLSSVVSPFMRDDSSMEHATHHPVMLSRRSSTPVTSKFTQRTSPNQNRNRPKRAQSLAAASSAIPCDLSRRKTERSGGSFILNQARAELNQTVLRQKMAVNEQRRSTLDAEFDPELAQHLEDEKLALALQNEEFLEILQQNEDFMKTLERDRMNATAFEPMAVSDSDDDHHEGYGEDKTQDPVHAFPYTKTVENENDQNAEFKKQLSQMGNSSKKKFQALARKFFSRKRKTRSPKQVLKESSAPSTLNLLEDNDDEDFEEGVQEEENPDRPTFEPLPGTHVSSVPSYKTVQRPPYHPDTIVTHHNDDKFDMV